MTNKAMTTKEHKPCPFCGAIPEKFDGDYFVKHAQTCVFKGQEWITSPARLDQWNTRAVDPELTAANAKIEALEADNAKLRDALNNCLNADFDVTSGGFIGVPRDELVKRVSHIANQALSSTPADALESLRKKIIADFVERVERKAEDKMLKTGKLEGAHYAAMKEIASIEAARAAGTKDGV